MNAATAPAFCAFSTLVLNSHVPRAMSAICPASEPAGKGLQPSVLPASAACAGLYGAGPSCVVTCAPKPAGPTARPTRFAGTGVGAVTLTSPGTTVAFFVTAPTPITFGEIAGEITVSVSGPALPFANTITTPASTALSAAWIIGSGHANVFWYDEPQELETTSAPSLTASSIALTSSTV